MFEDRAIEIVEHDTIKECEFRHQQSENLLKTVKENKTDCFHFFLNILQIEDFVCIRDKLVRPSPAAIRAGEFNSSYKQFYFFFKDHKVITLLVVDLTKLYVFHVYFLYSESSEHLKWRASHMLGKAPGKLDILLTTCPT